MIRPKLRVFVSSAAGDDRRASTRFDGAAMSAWTSPLELGDDGHDFARTRIDERLERALAGRRGTYARKSLARAFVADAREGAPRAAPRGVVVAVDSEAGREIARAVVRGTRGKKYGAVLSADADCGEAALGAEDGDDAWTTLYESGEGAPRVVIAETLKDISPTGARAWARETLRACGCEEGGETKVLALTSCSEHETSEAEMSLGAIDRVVAYALDTTRVRMDRDGAWPASPRPLPVGLLLRSNGAAAIASACEALGVAARVIAIPESEPVRVIHGGADVGASREAAAHASALVGCAVECEFKPRMAPTRAENLYA